MSWENARLNNECGANCTAEDFRRIDQQMAKLESAGTLAEIGKRSTLTPEQANNLAQLAIELPPGYGTGESLMQVMTGRSSVSDEEVSRFWAAVGVVPMAGGVLRRVGEPAVDALAAVFKVKQIERWGLGPNDLDFRGSGKNVQDAIDVAFQKTGLPKNEFEVTKWGRDASGKSFPPEWRHRSGAEVNVDWAHAKNGPDIPHVGFQTGGKRGDGGATRGHILLDDVPFNR